MDRVEQLEDCTISNALRTPVIGVGGALSLALVTIIQKKPVPLGPMLFCGTTGTMLDIILGIRLCESTKHAKRQMKLLEAQNLLANATAENGST